MSSVIKVGLIGTGFIAEGFTLAASATLKDISIQGVLTRRSISSMGGGV